MTLCWETAYKWACLSKQMAAWCLNRNSTEDGVIITVAFCIIHVCAPWIWGRAIATLMNQWANEAAIVLVYWNTLRKIEDSRTIYEVNAVVISLCCPASCPHSRRNSRRKTLVKKKRNKGHTLCIPLFSCMDWEWFGGQISWWANFVRTTRRAVDYPWASIIFVYQKMLIACFYEWEKIKS